MANEIPADVVERAARALMVIEGWTDAGIDAVFSAPGNKTLSNALVRARAALEAAGWAEMQDERDRLRARNEALTDHYDAKMSGSERATRIEQQRDEARAALTALEKRFAEKCTATCMTTDDYNVIMKARRALGEEAK